MSTYLRSIAATAFGALAAYLTAEPVQEQEESQEIELDIDKLPHDTRILSLAAKLSLIRSLSSLSLENRLISLNGGKSELFGEEILHLDVKSGEGSLSDYFKTLEISNGTLLQLELICSILYSDVVLFKRTLNKVKELSNSQQSTFLLKTKTGNGFSLLHLALICKEKQFFEDLLQLSAVKVVLNDTKNKYSLSPLSLAAVLRETWAFSPLLDAGSSVSIENNEGLTPMMLALVPTEQEIVSHEVNFSIPEEEMLPAKILNATSPENLENLVSHKTKTGLSALELASGLPHFSSVAALLSKGASCSNEALNSNVEAWTALMFACEDGRGDIVKLLLENGAEINAKSSKFDVTALHVAAFYGRSAIVDLLLRSGASSTALTTEKGSALLYSCLTGNVQCSKLILTSILAAKVENVDFFVLSALVTALKKGSIRCAQLLVLKAIEMDINISEIFEIALKNGIKDLVLWDLLLSTVGRVPEYEVSGENLLVSAAKSKNEELFSHLLRKFKYSQQVKEQSDVRTFVSEINSRSKGTNVAEMDTTCVVCFEKQSSTKFQPCGHIQCCKLCAAKTVRADPRCPMCREAIEKVEEL